MGKQKPNVVVDYAKCPPCPTLICVGVCPFGVLEVGANGKPQATDLNSCTCCGVCESLCPTEAIKVTKEIQKLN